MNFNTLEPGRELDALVAEKVMGYRLPEIKHPHWGKDFPRWVDDKGDVHVIPCYSTDIAAAWEVVEKFRPEKSFQIEAWGDNVHVHVWDVARVKCFAAIAKPTAPHAICLAALKAVGHD